MKGQRGERGIEVRHALSAPALPRYLQRQPQRTSLSACGAASAAYAPHCAVAVASSLAAPAICAAASPPLAATPAAWSATTVAASVIGGPAAGGLTLQAPPSKSPPQCHSPRPAPNGSVPAPPRRPLPVCPRPLRPYRGRLSVPPPAGRCGNWPPRSGRGGLPRRSMGPARRATGGLCPHSLGGGENSEHGQRSLACKRPPPANNAPGRSAPPHPTTPGRWRPARPRRSGTQLPRLFSCPGLHQKSRCPS